MPLLGIVIVVISKAVPEVGIGLKDPLTALEKREVVNDITKALTADVAKITDSRSKHGVDKTKKQPKDRNAAIKKAKDIPSPVLDIGMISALWDRLVSMRQT